MSPNERNTVLLEIAELVRDLENRSSHDEDDVVGQLIGAAAKFVPGAQYAGITLVDPKGRIETGASTHKYAVMLDDVQRRHLEGPCLSAGWEHHVIRIEDLERETRWPRYRDEALAATPIRSVLSVQSFADSNGTGAINFYAEETHAFDEESVELGLMFATHTALVWSIVNRDEQFRSALASRDVIGQAKGMIMERFDIHAVEAFELLKKLSQTSNMPVAVIARRLVEAAHPLT